MTTHVQFKRFTNGGGSLDSTPTAGNLLIVAVNHRDGTPSIPSSPSFTDFGVTGGGPGAQGCRMGYRTVQAGDTASIGSIGEGGAQIVVVEFPGTWSFITAIARDEPGADTTAFFGGNPNGITGHSGENGLLIGDDMGGSDGPTFTYSSVSGSVIVDQKSNGTAPSWAVGYRDVTNAGANEYLLATKSSSANTGGITGFFQIVARARSFSPGLIG